MSEISSRFPREKLGLLVALMTGVFLSPINVNFTSVALPSMREHFAVSVEQVSWVGTAYFIPTVVLMPLLAALGQRWGLRRMYILGFTLLGAGAFTAALAQEFGWLLAARALQGIGWSGLYPLALILIRKHFPIEQQGEVMGLWESAVGLAAVVGPVIGGLLVSALGWPAVYYGLGIVAGIGAVLGLANVPEDETIRARPEFDWAGAIGLTAAVLIVLVGITRRSAAFLSVGLAGMVVWGSTAKGKAAPFVHPAMFKNRRFLSAAGAAHLRMVIGIACVMSLPLFLEGVQKLSPVTVGILLPTYSVFLFLGARPGGKWADHAGSRAPGLAGFALMTIGVVMLIFMNAETGVLFIGIALAVRGIGAGVSQSPFAKAATAAFGEEKADVAAGLYGMVRYSGLALGSTLVGVLLNERLAFYGSTGKDAAAVPAFQELFIMLAFVGLIGILLSWTLGQDNLAPETVSGLPAEVAHG